MQDGSDERDSTAGMWLRVNESEAFVVCDKPGEEVMSCEKLGSSENMVFRDEVASGWARESAL